MNKTRRGFLKATLGALAATPLAVLAKKEPELDIPNLRPNAKLSGMGGNRASMTYFGNREDLTDFISVEASDEYFSDMICVVNVKPNPLYTATHETFYIKNNSKTHNLTISL